jgi:c-di-GMP-binding flagellar brake protein YcgR
MSKDFGAAARQEFIKKIESRISAEDLLSIRNTEDENARSYEGKVLSLIEGKLAISWPHSNGVRMLLHKDQILHFQFRRSGALYEFSGLVDDLARTPQPLLTVIFSSPIQEVQRRENTRIRCSLAIEIVGSIRENPEDATQTSVYFKTVTSDLSVGGLAIRHLKRIPEGALLEVKLSMPDGGTDITVPCRSIYSDDPQDEQMMFRTGLQFLAIKEGDRGRIIRYLYKAQLKGTAQQ